MRALKQWSGYSFRGGRQMAVWIGAYSRADARRVLVEHGLMDPGESHMRDYFSTAWGRRMDGVALERGVWAANDRHGNDEPKRLPKVAP